MHNNRLNKKVLLRERKRHTACRVVSTHSVVLSWLTPPPTARLNPSTRLTPPLHQTDPPAGLTPHPARLTPPRWTLTPPCRTDPHPPSTGLTPPGLTPPPVDRQKDRHVSKHYLPVVLRTRALIIGYPQNYLSRHRYLQKIIDLESFVAEEHVGFRNKDKCTVSREVNGFLEAVFWAVTDPSGPFHLGLEFAPDLQVRSEKVQAFSCAAETLK